MEDNSNKASWFVRILIAALCLMLSAMVIYRFFYVIPVGDISAGVITLLCLLLVLVLAESFDSFSIGKLLSVSREIKKKEKEVEKLERKNGELLSQLIAVSNSQVQTQSHTNVYGDYHAGPTVRKATEEEVKDKQSSETAAATVAAEASSNSSSSEAARPRTNWVKAEEMALSRYIDQRQINRANVISDAKLVSHFDGVDPISNTQPIFDAYIRDMESEIFIDIRPERLISPPYRDRLYVLLSKINHYRSTKRVNAHLDLVLVKVPGEEGPRYYPVDRFFEAFSPAIATGLLRVVTIGLSEEDAALLKG